MPSPSFTFAGVAPRFAIAAGLRLLSESDVVSCLNGRQLLNVGSDVAVDIQRGFGRLNQTTQAWTHRRPGSSREQRLRFSQRLPTVADFNYQFERTGGFNGRGPDIMAGKAIFGRGSVGTQFLQHPPHYGLANMLEPSGVHSAGRVGFRSPEQYAKFMCAHDIVVLESGLADVGLPFTEHVTWAVNRVLPKCAGRSAGECEAALSGALQGETWRRMPLLSYRRRLATLLDIWSTCRRRKPSFRAILKLSPAPRARQRPADCSLAQWGFSVYAHHLQLVNRVARELVERAGFEVFDGFGLTLHAPPSWFDEARHGVRFKIHESEALSDVTTQAFLNHLCHRP